MKIAIRILPILVTFITTSLYPQDLTQNQKIKILKVLTSAIEENYILQDSVPHILSGLSEAENSQEFKKETSAAAFGSYMTTLLRKITKDAQFAVLSDSSLFQMALTVQQNEGNQGNSPIALGGRIDGSRKNFFFTKLEVLEGNIGYIKLDQIPSLESAKSTVDAAMAFLTNTDAMIIDLRSNPGGIGGFIPYLMSYFFPEEEILLYTREFLAMDTIAYLYTHKELGSPRYLDKPVYILINSFTGSAATNMAYTMKSFEAATLVGQNTGSGYRGAHSATIIPLQDNLVALIPVGRVVNARTKTNWRAKGVDPDIACDPEKALSMAHEAALHFLISKNTDVKIAEELNIAMSNLLGSLESEPNKTEAVDLSEYAGQYGETTITWEGNKLYTKRPTVAIKLELQRKEDDLFKIILPANARGNVPDLRFNRENGKIISVTTVRDGKEERTEARKK